MRAIRFIVMLLGFICVSLPAIAAEKFPSRPIKFVVGFLAGGPTDTTARIFCEWLSQHLGTCVVENKVGQGGMIAAASVANAPPDGYTILFIGPNNFIGPSLYKNLSFNHARDTVAVAGLARLSNLMVVPPSLPVKTVGEFIAYAKANPGKLSYGSAGVGSASHLAAELLKEKAGIDMVHVPNKGMNPALIDLMGGQVQVLFASVPGLTAEKAQRVHVIAMAELKRSALMPDLPTMDESGLPGFAVGNWAGLLGPPGLDPAIVKKLHDEVIAILATPEMKERVKTLGYDLVESSPQEFARQLQDDVGRWGPVAKAANAEKK
jgi:tripartite-type tricarboxylate transporter receptor subunit TctC